MSTWITNVHQFQDGVDSLSASSVNPVINSLVQREQYLFEQINDIAAQNMLVSINQPLDSSLSTGSVGNPIYFNTDSGSGVLMNAIGGYTAANNNGHLFPAESAYVFGILKQVYAGSGVDGIYYGDVYVRGLITDTNINYYNLLDTISQSNVSVLTPSPLYLSSTEAGKLTIYPSGAGVFVGYYLGGSNFVLAPNIDSLNQLYFNYRLYLTPNVSGMVTGSTTLSVTGGDITKLGWISASDAYSLLGITGPSGALFYYNLPTDAYIQSAFLAGYLTQEQAQHATLLKQALPAHPASYSMMFVNGVLQTQYDTDHTLGIYIIDANGIWWMTNAYNYVPWSGGGTVTGYTITNGGSGYGSAPTVTLAGGAGSGATATSTISSGVVTAITITNPGSGYMTPPIITIADPGSGTTATATALVTLTSSPTVELFITKLNPNYAASIVTSLESTTNGIIVNSLNDIPATTGDLELTLNLGVGLTTTNTGVGTAVQSLSFDSSSASLVGNIAPVINTIVVGPGLNYSVTNGQATLSLTNFSLSGEVTDIEPQESDFVYKGLHSYLRLKRPQANQLIGFIGKLKIPDNIPTNTNLSFNLLGFTETGSSTSSAYISFEFDYAVSNSGTSISTAITNSTVYTLGSNFPTLAQAQVSTGYISSISGNPVTCFTIPSSAFTSGSYVNFRIARTYDSSATYTNPIGIVGVTWQIK